MTHRLEHRAAYMGESIGNDPQLRAVERETCFRMSDASPLVDFDTHNAAMIRAFLATPFVMGKRIEVLMPEDVVVGLSGSFPIGALSIHEPRQDDRPSRVVSRAARDPKRGTECVVSTQSGDRGCRTRTVTLTRRGTSRESANLLCQDTRATVAA